MTFDVVGIFLQYLFRETFGFRHRRRGLLAAHQVVIAELHPYVEIVGVQLRSLLHLFERFLVTLEAFVGVRQSPMGIGELLVDLQSAAKLERCFLKLFVFQQRLSAGNVLGFGFFGGRARADEQRGDDRNDKQKKGRELSAALVIFHYYSP